MALLLAACNCDSRTQTTDTGDESSGGDSETSGSDPDLPLQQDLPPLCDAPTLLCGGECIDPEFDNNHCGECNHACMVPPEEYYPVGRCWGDVPTNVL